MQDNKKTALDLIKIQEILNFQAKNIKINQRISEKYRNIE